MTKRAKNAAVGPWAKEKLGALAAYLDYYTKVLKNQARWCKGTIYVDAFAGPGKSLVRSSREIPEQGGLLPVEPVDDEGALEYIKGSPRVALDLQNPFSHYVFIEADPDRVKELEVLQAEYGDGRSIEIAHGDATTTIAALLARGIDWRSHRAVIFLDPWGMQLKWQTLAQLAKTCAIEVIINFPLGMAIQRLFTKSGDIPEGWQRALDEYFGSPDWRQLVYEESSDLLGPTLRKAPDAAIRVLNWYRDRLRAIFGHVSEARLITSTKEHPLYYLVWAGPHERGLKGANYILKKAMKIK